MTKTRNLADLGGGFIQAGTGAVQRTVESKLQDVVSVKDFGAVGDGVTDVAPIITQAWLTHDVIGLPEPDVSWRLATTLVVPSGKKLVSLTADYVKVSGTAAFLFDFTNTVDSEISKLDITGADSGTSYQIRLNGASYNTIDVKIKDGNSGISLDNSNFNEISLKCHNMRGTTIKLDTNSTQNYIDKVIAINVAGFGVLMEGGASQNYVGSIQKYLHVASLNSSLIASEAADLALGRIGLEALGIRIDSSQNTISSVHAFDTADNGVSVTGSANSIAVIHARNCDNDGLHLYGSHNTVGSLVSEFNAQSGLGISQSATTGEARFNVVGSAVTLSNGWYGLNIADGSVTAIGNHVSISSNSDALGPFSAAINSLDNLISSAQNLHSYRYTGAADARGVGAVDFQSTRTASDQVASGTNAFIGAGVRNKARGANCAVVSGSDNDTANTSAFVGGGASNAATGSYSVIPGGRNNTTSRQYSTIIGGQNGLVRADGQVVIPCMAATTGAGGTSGLQQKSENLLGAITSDVTSTRLVSNGAAASSTNQITLPNFSTFYVYGNIIARSPSREMRIWEISAAISRGNGAGTTLIEGTPTITSVYNTAGASTWSVSISADTTNGALAVNVVGQAATNIRWQADLRASEMANTSSIVV